MATSPKHRARALTALSLASGRMDSTGADERARQLALKAWRLEAHHCRVAA